MNKPKSTAAERQDWFVSAIRAEGGVFATLSVVEGELARKLNFLRQLRENLCQDSIHDLDQASVLAKQVKELENTLRFRLGIMRPERKAAWFRKAIRSDFGPFKSSLLLDPIFAPYDPERDKELRIAIEKAWTDGKVERLPFQDNASCIWRILLAQKARYFELITLKEPFADLTLDKLPENLPLDLESHSLRAFLINVQAEFASIREKLNVCYEQLMSASERFWAYQDHERKSERKKHETFGARGTKAHSPPPKQKFISYQEMQALQFMGFRRAPTAAELRKRYLEMAKKLHPDHGGNEDAFKMLGKAYEELSKSS